MRRYAPLAPSRGTRIPNAMRVRVANRDRGCVGRGRLPGDCAGAWELDHVRASHAMGKKSVTCDCNLVQLCGSHHRFKTENGRAVRALLLLYLEHFEYDEHSDGHISEPDCGHIDPLWSCATCQSRRVSA